MLKKNEVANYKTLWPRAQTGKVNIPGTPSQGFGSQTIAMKKD